MIPITGADVDLGRCRFNRILNQRRWDTDTVALQACSRVMEQIPPRGVRQGDTDAFEQRQGSISDFCALRVGEYAEGYGH
jgi:hypothetical protein